MEDVALIVRMSPLSFIMIPPCLRASVVNSTRIRLC
jgi:hypothetical protein